MKFIQKSKTTYLLTCTVGCLFVLAGCSSDDDSPVVDIDDSDDTPVPTTTVTVSGTITNTSGAPLSGVAVEGVYTSPGDASNAMTATDAAGLFNLTVNANTPFYLRGSFSDYATLNSEKGILSTDVIDEDIEMPTTNEAQAIIDAAFPTAMPRLENHAWLAVDVYDTNDNEVGGETVSSTVTPAGFAYIDCDGSASATGTTVACPTRDGTMYLAYFTSAAEATVTVDGDDALAPLNLGEITVLEYEVAAAVIPPPPEPSAFELGRDYYDANCAGCHSAGSYDPDGFAGNLASVPIPLLLSTIQGMGSVADIDATIQFNLETFLFDASIQ